MNPEHIIEFVGGGEEDVAYLRLLLRKAAPQLNSRWRLRREDDAHVDLLVVEDIDSSSLPLAEASKRRVRVIDPKLSAAGMETVPWPVAQETLIRLLNLPRFRLQPASVPVSPPQLEPQPPAPTPVLSPLASALNIQHNIYDDLFEPEESDRWGGGHDVIGEVDLSAEWMPHARANETALMREAENFFRQDPRTAHLDALRAIRLDSGVDVEITEGHTLGTGSRKDRRGLIELGSDTPHTLSVEDAKASYPLASYLSGRLLPGPAQIELAQVRLTLDPRNRQYYARGGLCVFEASCKPKIRRGEWRVLSASEFAEVKSQLDARPYAELQWLCAYINGDVDQPDEILRYRVLQNLDLRDYPGAARVAQELLKSSSLRSASAAAGVSMAEAMRVAAAFDAAGLLVPD